jgi:hypothetical protein
MNNNNHNIRNPTACIAGIILRYKNVISREHKEDILRCLKTIEENYYKPKQRRLAWLFSKLKKSGDR